MILSLPASSICFPPYSPAGTAVISPLSTQSSDFQWCIVGTGGTPEPLPCSPAQRKEADLKLHIFPQADSGGCPSGYPHQLPPCGAQSPPMAPRRYRSDLLRRARRELAGGRWGRPNARARGRRTLGPYGQPGRAVPNSSAVVRADAKPTARVARLVRACCTHLESLCLEGWERDDYVM